MLTKKKWFALLMLVAWKKIIFVSTFIILVTTQKSVYTFASKKKWKKLNFWKICGFFFHIFSRTYFQFFFNRCSRLEMKFQKKKCKKIENILLILGYKHVFKNSVKKQKLSPTGGNNKKHSKFRPFFCTFFWPNAHH